MNIVVFGKSGQLAQELAGLETTKTTFVLLGRDDVDLMNASDITEKLVSCKANAVINASAYTAVDQAETDQQSAFNLNEVAVKNIAECCKQLNIHVVQVSTDFVFNGKGFTPYLTTDQKQPIGVYGQSKANGEDALIHAYAQNSCIIRTSWVYSVYSNNFVKTIIRLSTQKEQLGIIADQIGSPTCAKGLAIACLDASMAKKIGIYHWTDLGVASWYDFAVAIQELAFTHKLLTKTIPIKPIRTEDYPTPAKRPNYSVLDKTGNETVFTNSKAEHWRSRLNTMLENLVKDNHE
ncbi:MAG: dTDP-4-dehydrorhamnose reductase [Alphaproteobacteria bacterium]|jgi:dTDP-4-dehydrorhamnose reductase